MFGKNSIKIYWFGLIFVMPFVTLASKYYMNLELIDKLEYEHNVTIHDYSKFVKESNEREDKYKQTILQLKEHLETAQNDNFKKIIIDLDKQSLLSLNDKEEVFNSIKEASEKFDIDPVILYSVIWTESRFKYNMDHSETYIKALNKKIRAIGLGGIVYEFWGDKLKEAKIIETRQDLYKIKNNIHASAYVLNYYYNQPMFNSANSKTESMLMRYYGSQTAGYQNRVLQKAGTVLLSEITK